MELGKRLRQARLEQGISQRQLCGEEITRNMLSLIENGSARPSMKTLEYLARKLGKPLSFFLDENAEEKQQNGNSNHSSCISSAVSDNALKWISRFVF